MLMRRGLANAGVLLGLLLISSVTLYWNAFGVTPITETEHSINLEPSRCIPCSNGSNTENLTSDCCGGGIFAKAEMQPWNFDGPGYAARGSIMAFCADSDGTHGCQFGCSARVVFTDAATQNRTDLFYQEYTLTRYCGATDPGFVNFFSRIKAAAGDGDYKVTVITYDLPCDGSTNDKGFQDISSDTITVASR